MSTPSDYTEARRGATYGAIAIFCGVAGGVTQKLLTGIPIGQVLIDRSVLAATIVLVILLATDGRRALRPLSPAVLARAGLDAFAALTFAIAVPELSISLLTALNLTLPIVTAALAFPLLGERILRQQWIAILLGSVGALLVVRPAWNASPLGLVMVVLSTFGFAMRDIVTRKIPGDTLRTVVLSLAFIAIAALFLPRTIVGAPVPNALIWIVASALSQVVASVLIIEGIRRAGIAVIATLRFTSIVWAVLFDVIIWQVWPDAPTWAGIVAITTSVLVLGSTIGRQTV